MRPTIELICEFIQLISRIIELICPIIELIIRAKLFIFEKIVFQTNFYLLLLPVFKHEIRFIGICVGICVRVLRFV